MLRDDIIAALRSVELPADIRARMPYGQLADAVQPVLFDAVEAAASHAIPHIDVGEQLCSCGGPWPCPR